MANMAKILVKGKQLVTVEKTKNLGILIDTKLRFREHVKRVIRTGYCDVKILKKKLLVFFERVLSSPTSITVTLGMVLPQTLWMDRETTAELPTH
ncbi:hypothetical protein Trydic_g2473 [Trypoxylus dichotomus]